jgi:hypothetical protein
LENFGRVAYRQRLRKENGRYLKTDSFCPMEDESRFASKSTLSGDSLTQVVIFTRLPGQDSFG